MAFLTPRKTFDLKMNLFISNINETFEDSEMFGKCEVIRGSNKFEKKTRV